VIDFSSFGVGNRIPDEGMEWYCENEKGFFIEGVEDPRVIERGVGEWMVLVNARTNGYLSRMFMALLTVWEVKGIVMLYLDGYEMTKKEKNW